MASVLSIRHFGKNSICLTYRWQRYGIATYISMIGYRNVLNLEINLRENKCHFEQCVHYADGECQSEDARKNCLDIALAVLCCEESYDEGQD